MVKQSANVDQGNRQLKREDGFSKDFAAQKSVYPLICFEFLNFSFGRTGINRR